MKKNMVIGSILIILLMLCMPMISNVQAEENTADENMPSRKIFLKCPLVICNGYFSRIIPILNGRFIFVKTSYIHQLTIMPAIGDDIDLEDPGFNIAVLLKSGSAEYGNFESLDLLSGSGIVFIIE